MAKKQKLLIGTLISVIVFLSIVCVISIIYNFYGGFYFSRVVEYDKILGQEQTIEVTGEGSFAVACNFSGTILLDDDIRQDINIKSLNLTQNLYLRAKVVLVGAKEQDNKIFGVTNWEEKNDEYIYFNQTISANEKIGMCKYVRLSQNLILDTNKNYILIFIVETSYIAFI
ncbi:MAG: hypothetical protein E7376_03310 [Clostridiales bacterium]|nr:hypothetical protein [Clostridiales bacterium]